MTQRLLILIVILLTTSIVVGQEDIGSKTVIGPRNADLYNGANLIKSGNATGDLELIRRGTELTLQGLTYADGREEEEKGLSNLCAGYIILKELDKAINYCDLAVKRNPENWHAYSNRALAFVFKKDYVSAKRDIDRGLQLNPDSRILLRVQALYLDATQPVEQQITIDDRTPDGN